jgi:hypothetical protein
MMRPRSMTMPGTRETRTDDPSRRRKKPTPLASTTCTGMCGSGSRT